MSPHLKLNLIDPLELFISEAPKPIQSVRFAARAGFVQTFQPKANRDWKARIKAVVTRQLPAGWKPYKDTPLGVRVIYVFPPLTSFRKSDKEIIEAGGVIPKHTKPDVSDNLNKGLFDAMTGVIWDDDSRVAYVECLKVHGNKVGIHVEVGRLNLEREEDEERRSVSENV